MENLYYINKQNVLTDKIKKAVYEMNYNVRILSKEVDMLEEKIDKAIDYIEKFIPINNDKIILSERQRDYLLEILGDKENE